MIQKARANRLKGLRRITRLSRRKFAKLHGISSGTLQNWEDARYGGLTEKGAKKILEKFKHEGILCSFEWLMYGIEPGPQLSEKLFLDDKHQLVDGMPTWESQPIVSRPALINQEREIQWITEEILLLRKHYPDLIECLITDDLMQPRFHVGEQVAGRRRYAQDINRAVGMDCIIDTREGDRFVRRLHLSRQEGVYDLYCLNAQTEQIKIIREVHIESVAPIIWIRRKDGVI